MLLKNISYLFKAFGQSGEMDFFFSFSSTPICFCLFYIILSIYKESEWLEATIFMVCSTCIVSLAFFFFLNAYSYSSFATLFLVCSIRNVSQNNKY